MKILEPHFMIDLTLYPPEAGGRNQPISREGFACPCKLDRNGNTFADCRLYLQGQSIRPGETKRVGIRFSFEPAARIFLEAGKFYLWDSRVIGEAVVVVK